MKIKNRSNHYNNINTDTGIKNVLKSKEFQINKAYDFKIIENNPLPLFSSCCVHHPGRQFACIYDYCNDHTNCFRNEMDNGNPEYHAILFHSEDRKLWCEQAFPDILKFIGSLSNPDFQDYRFSFNHRYIHPDGSISQFLHEGTLHVNDVNSLPMLKLKMFTEIGDIKTDSSMVLTIFRHSVEWGFQKVFNKVYATANNLMLSLRELEIIKFCAEGLSSKMIAEKLNLSIHTIKNHKRNCMKKTSTHNITELIHLCKQNHCF